MPRKFPKRQTRNILVIYVDITADAIKQILIWNLNPNNLAFGVHGDNTYFNSGNIIEDDLSIKAVMEKASFFIRDANDTGSIDTLPDLIIWDRVQLDVLQKYITSLPKLINKNITMLQERCYHIFKYNPSCQNFSIGEIADVMGFGDDDIMKQMGKISLKTEQMFRDGAKKLKYSKQSAKQEK